MPDLQIARAGMPIKGAHRSQQRATRAAFPDYPRTEDENGCIWSAFDDRGDREACCWPPNPAPAISILTPELEVFMRLRMFSFLTRCTCIRARRSSAGTWDMRRR